jgi:hypothetical protein
MRPIILLFLVGIVNATEEVPAEIQSIADTVLKDQMVCYAAQTSPGSPQHRNLKNIRVGVPFQSHPLDVNLIIKDSSDLSVTNKIRPGFGWSIPLMENNVPFLIVNVVKGKEGNWKIQGVGAHEFAAAWGIINRIWKGHQIILCSAPPRAGAYFFIPDKGDNNLTVIIPVGRKEQNALEPNEAKSYYSKLTPSSTIFKSIRERYENRKESNKLVD